MISKQGLQMRLVATFAAAALGFGVAAFLAVAAYIELLNSMPPSSAALVMAAACLSLLLLGWLLTRLVLNALRRKPGGDPADALERALQLHAGPALKSWICEHPDRAVALAALLGVAAGYNPAANRVIQDLFRHLIEERPGR